MFIVLFFQHFFRVGSFQNEDWGTQKRETGVTEQHSLNNSDFRVTVHIRGMFAHTGHQMRQISCVSQNSLNQAVEWL